MLVEERLARALLTDQPEQAARLLDGADPGDVAALLAELAPGEAAAVYRELSPGPAAATSILTRDEVLAGIVMNLPLDRAAATMRPLEPARRNALLEQFPPDQRAHLRALLAYPSDTAGALADPLALALPEDISMREARHQMRGSARHLFYQVFIIARDRTLRGTMDVQELMRARPRQRLATVMARDVVAVDAFTPLATVAVHPAWRNFDALPVIDADHKLIGAIRHRMIRQLAPESPRHVMDTIVGLSELYWVGLSGLLTSFAPAQHEAEGNSHGT